MPLGIARIGAVVGSSQNSARVDDLDSSSHTTGTHLGFYGSIQAGAFQLLGGAAYAWQDVSTNRTIGFGTFSGVESSHYDASTTQGYLDGSYAFTLGHDTLAPYLNVARVQLHTDAASENGGAPALNVGADTSSSTYATLGVRGVFALDAQGDINAHASLGWQKAWGTTASSSSVQFQAGGDAFDVSGVPVARHAGVADVGVSFALAKSFSADISYDGQYAGHAKDQAARMNFTWTF
jgi:uncharacterized protein with beta-barrel porin domain